jgi:CheY-like chemotaxis protein
MGGFEWVVLSEFILLAVILFYFRRKAKLKAGKDIKGQKAATTAQATAIPPKTGAPQIQPSGGVADLAEVRIAESEAVSRPVDEAKAKPQSRILVVDDDPKACDLLTTKLRLSGFMSQSCTNSEAALKLLRTQRFDAIISDLNMPGMSGMNLLDAARRVSPEASFLMAIGVGDVSVGVSAMKQGASDYILVAIPNGGGHA